MPIKKIHWTYRSLWDNVAISNGAAILIAICLLFTLAVFKISTDSIENSNQQRESELALQHKTSVIVYKACRSDTVAEQNANRVVGQLRLIIRSQAEIAKAMNLTKIVTEDSILMAKLPVFPPLPPCGERP